MSAAKWIGECVLKAILMEACTWPKPGLVTPVSQGAHADMDIWLFITSSTAIAPCFHDCAQLGVSHQGTPPSLLHALRVTGIRYEKRLLQSTNQVNTQRGILFAGSLLAAAAGWLHGRNEVISYETLSQSVKAICQNLCRADFSALDRRPPQTHGEKLYLNHGITGIRGEAENGFPLVRNTGLPALHQALEAGLSWREALVHTLLALMARCDDTTILSRGGFAALAEMKSRAGYLVALGGMQYADIDQALNDFNAWCLSQWVSPGGSADLLALCLAMYFLCHPSNGEIIKETI
ncbi:TPA: triphosphoribosyl-dephospho-CoA synthase [Kluyvera georgiana]|nr:triphosphoribosyl-dephospho-CoA synthase [Kluyvera georgiana]